MLSGSLRSGWTHPRPALLSLGLVVALFLPSTGTVQKYLDTAAVLAYFLALLLLVPVALTYLLPLFLRLAGGRSPVWLAGATLVALVVAFAVLYPLANSGALGGGSDRDDAVNIATRRLLHLAYPYHALTYLGNDVSNLPGSLLLAVPFVAIGNSAYQNVFWLAVGFLAFSAYLRDARQALFAVWTILLLSPAVARELVTGGDLISNNVYLLLFLVGLLLAERRWTRIALAVALGVALSTRANFLFAVPLLASALVQKEGWAPALRSTGLVLATFAAVTLPFYLYDPAGFTPIHTAQKVNQFNTVVPYASSLILALGAVLAAALSLTRMDGRGIALTRNCALVQAWFIVSAVVLSSVRSGRVDFSFLISGYGLNMLFFSVVAVWAAWAAHRVLEGPEPPSPLADAAVGVLNA